MDNYTFRPEVKDIDQSVAQAIAWIRNNMSSFDEAYWGIYERLRIDLNQRVPYCRPDCNAEFARVLMWEKLINQSTDNDRLTDNVIRWLLLSQSKDGSFPFYLIEGFVDVKEGRTIYQNDNGKVLIALSDIYQKTGRDDVLDSANRLADFWVGIQVEDGSFKNMSLPHLRKANGPIFVLWLIAGLYRLYGAAGSLRYKQCADRALKYVMDTHMISDRIKTSYEHEKVEDWRPLSSEIAIALFCFAEVYKLNPSQSLFNEMDKVGKFLLRLQHPTGGIVNNLTDVGSGVSLQRNPDLCDLVYTEGFALMALCSAYRATNDNTYLEAAGLLAKFLIGIQCEGESQYWDGAWRGAYNVLTKTWDGRCDQNNLIDEGGMYSVYTGWTATTIMQGLLELKAIYSNLKI